MEAILYFFCFDHLRPSGGVRKIYRQVDVLNRNGISAAVLHVRRGFACRWFRHETRIAYIEDLNPGSVRCLVLPEIAGAEIHQTVQLSPARFLRPARYLDVGAYPKVIFNQNFYLTPPQSLYQDPSINAVLTVSADSLVQLRASYSGVKLLRIHNSVDTALFYPRIPKKRVIAYMPRKGEKRATQIVAQLRQSARTHGFIFDRIAGVSEAETARRLGEATLYLSLTEREGFGMSAAEAMASGCVVIGFPAGGGTEFFNPAYCLPVTDGDVSALVRQAQYAMSQTAQDANWSSHHGEQAAAMIRARYSPAQEESDILDAWQKILPLLES